MGLRRAGRRRYSYLHAFLEVSELHLCENVGIYMESSGNHDFVVKSRDSTLFSIKTTQSLGIWCLQNLVWVMVSLPICWACRDYAILPPKVAILGEMCGFPPNVGGIWWFPLKWCHFGTKWCFGGPGAQTPTKPIGFIGVLRCFRV